MKCKIRIICHIWTITGSNYQHHSINYWVKNVFQAPSDQLLSLSAMSSWARRELSLHLAALTFSHFRGLLPIIRFEDFLSAPLLMCNSQVCLEGCFHVAAAQWKKKRERGRSLLRITWGKSVSSGNNDPVDLTFTWTIATVSQEEMKEATNAKKKSHDLSLWFHERKTDYPWLRKLMTAASSLLDFSLDDEGLIIKKTLKIPPLP